MLSLRSHFSRYYAAAPERIHLAAHSHHYWPDVSFTAQQTAWTDAARLADRKWDHVLGEIMPRVQAHLARLLNSGTPEAIAFAPNTHDFLVRLLSTLDVNRPVRVLTTDSEFHSLERQIGRLEEDGLALVTRIPVEPFLTFPVRFTAAAATGGYDLVFFSHVFFNSGYVVPDIDALVSAVPDEDSLVIVDGYHAVMALPVDIAAIADRAFYLAGGYKYLMAGEGCCFLHCPPSRAPRPRITGWYAAFGALSEVQAELTPYAADGRRFLGSTFDPTALYRLLAVLDWLEALDLTPHIVHEHALRAQEIFLEGVAGVTSLSQRTLLMGRQATSRGNFLTFRTQAASLLYARLEKAGIVVDYRHDRLRFGFGLYHEERDVVAAGAAVTDALT